MPEIKKVPFESLDETIKNLLRGAVEGRNYSYSPYSKFKVGACLLTQDGQIFKGCNIENATFSSICAERTALVKAISEGKTKFSAIAVVAHQKKFDITSPCGTCRQFLSEFGDMPIYMSKPDLTEVYVSSIYELLPLHFEPNSDFTFE